MRRTKPGRRARAPLWRLRRLSPPRGGRSKRRPASSCRCARFGLRPSTSPSGTATKSGRCRQHGRWRSALLPRWDLVGRGLCQRRGARDQAQARRQGVRLSRGVGRSCARRRGARSHPQARNPAGLDRGLDLRRPRGHIQAVGRDGKGRKQYRYHDDWSAERGGGQVRPHARPSAGPCRRMRGRVGGRPRPPGAAARKVLATAVRLLEITLIRVGNREYARDQQELRPHHPEQAAPGARGRRAGVRTSRARAGSGTGWAYATGGSRACCAAARSCRASVCSSIATTTARGPHRIGRRQRLPARDRGRGLLGQGFPHLGRHGVGRPRAPGRAGANAKAEARRMLARCCRAVSGLLGNTPSVCRASYIHPAVLDAYVEGRLAEALPEPEDEAFEAALIGLLDPSPGRGRMGPVPKEREIG